MRNINSRALRTYAEDNKITLNDAVWMSARFRESLGGYIAVQNHLEAGSGHRCLVRIFRQLRRLKTVVIALNDRTIGANELEQKFCIELNHEMDNNAQRYVISLIRAIDRSRLDVSELRMTAMEDWRENLDYRLPGTFNEVLTATLRNAFTDTMRLPHISKLQIDRVQIDRNTQMQAAEAMRRCLNALPNLTSLSLCAVTTIHLDDWIIAFHNRPLRHLSLDNFSVHSLALLQNVLANISPTVRTVSLIGLSIRNARVQNWGSWASRLQILRSNIRFMNLTRFTFTTISRTPVFEVAPYLTFQTTRNPCAR